MKVNEKRGFPLVYPQCPEPPVTQVCQWGAPFTNLVANIPLRPERRIPSDLIYGSLGVLGTTGERHLDLGPFKPAKTTGVSFLFETTGVWVQSPTVNDYSRDRKQQ